MTLRTLLLLILSLTITCCTDKPSDIRLSRVENLSSESPKEAWDSLGAINYDLLSDADKHYYDFLSVKVADKAYLTHSSDSLIFKVIDFESKHQKYGRYSEALYYGGRVYSDLGDYPTALHYFQNAIDLLPPESTNLKLRCVVLSQTARLLNSLRLYSQAIPNIESAIAIDRQLKDSINEIYDLQLLGSIYLRSHNYRKAEKYFLEAMNLSKDKPTHHRAKSAMYLAEVKHRLGFIDSALVLIRNTPDLVNPIARNSALAYASEIYRSAGLIDTAYLYAHELINSPSTSNKETGYHILLSPPLRNKISPDSINKYLTDYLYLLETYYNENENQLALNQQSSFNYQLHERERTKAENSNILLKKWMIGCLFIILLLGIIILFLKNRDKNNILKLRDALENIDKLTLSLKGVSSEQPDKDNEVSILTPVNSNETVQDLRNKLRSKLLSIYNASTQPIFIDPQIIGSEAYSHLQDYISKGSEIKDNNPLWKKLERVILDCSPHFIENLRLLVGGKLTSYDLHTSILIKCGVQPLQMSSLLNRTKGTITSRRESLCFRVFDEKLGTKVIDGIIRLL